MNGPRRADLPDGPPTDVTKLLEDDLLLDRLGRGELPAGHEDDAVETLSRWRATLPDPDTPDEPLLAAALTTVRRSRRAARWARGSLAAATAAVLACGGVTAAAQDAAPGSPLWPVTELVYPDRAASRAAADAVDQARAAMGEGRYEAAAQLLDQASSWTRRVDGTGEGDRLRTDIAELRAAIAAQPTAAVPGPEADPGARPTAPAVTPPATPQPPATPRSPTTPNAPETHQPAGSVPTGTGAVQPDPPGGLPSASAPMVGLPAGAVPEPATPER